MKEYKTYSIEKLNDSFLFIILNDATRLNFALPIINQDLKLNHFRGQVVFDLLLSNGNNSRRYFQSIFDGEAIDLNTFARLNNVPEEFSIISKNYLRNNPDILENGILSKAEISRIRGTL